MYQARAVKKYWVITWPLTCLWAQRSTAQNKIYVYLYKQWASLLHVNLSLHHNAKWIEGCTSCLKLRKGENVYSKVRKNYSSFTLLSPNLTSSLHKEDFLSGWNMWQKTVPVWYYFKVSSSCLLSCRRSRTQIERDGQQLQDARVTCHRLSSGLMF